MFLEIISPEFEGFWQEHDRCLFLPARVKIRLTSEIWLYERSQVNSKTPRRIKVRAVSETTLATQSKPRVKAVGIAVAKGQYLNGKIWVDAAPLPRHRHPALKGQSSYRLFRGEKDHGFRY